MAAWTVDGVTSITVSAPSAVPGVSPLCSAEDCGSGSVIWAVVLPMIPDRKMAYSISLVIGAIGFCAVPFIGNQYVLFVPYLLIGCAWAAMLAMPFAIVTNALEGYGHMGVYLGLFNGTICIPQIVAAATGGAILSAVGSYQYNMMIVAGVALAVGAICVFFVKDKTLSRM